MKVLMVTCLIVVTASASHLEFQDFKLKHGRSYKTPDEEEIRFNIFQDNVRAIKEHNSLYEQGLVTYKKGINRFADITKEEFKAMLTLSASSKPILNATKHVNTGLQVPDFVDWRTEGQVTEIKDQGICGSCWAFSLTGSIEAAYYRKTGNLTSLSEQQLVDCSRNINDGCGGGYLGRTFSYLEKAGLESEEMYPYTGSEEPCKYKSARVVTKVSGYTSIQEDEDALLDAVANVGPVSVTMDSTDLSLYEFGIYEIDHAFSILNHAVLIVGYGTKNGTNYWIVKNSWGSSWGEKGYFRIIRGQNECGIAEENVYPIV